MDDPISGYRIALAKRRLIFGTAMLLIVIKYEDDQRMHEASLKMAGILGKREEYSKKMEEGL